MPTSRPYFGNRDVLNRSSWELSTGPCWFAIVRAPKIPGIWKELRLIQIFHKGLSIWAQGMFPLIPYRLTNWNQRLQVDSYFGSTSGSHVGPIKLFFQAYMALRNVFTSIAKFEGALNYFNQLFADVIYSFQQFLSTKGAIYNSQITWAT